MEAMMSDVQTTPNADVIAGVRNQINKVIDGLAGRCGCSHDVHLDKFSQGIDRLLENEPDEDRKALILQLAREEDYMTREEIYEMQRESQEAGFCIHGIDPDCCPAGCGDIE